MPYGRAVDLRVADDIREHKQSAFKWKLTFLLYNHQRLHQSQDYQTPAAVYFYQGGRKQ
jgi:hypothetical protein